MKNFLAQFQGWAHWFAGLAVTAVTVYSTNDAVHVAVNNAIASNKKLVAVLGTISSVLLAYSNSKKAA